MNVRLQNSDWLLSLTWHRLNCRDALHHLVRKAGSKNYLQIIFDPGLIAVCLCFVLSDWKRVSPIFYADRLHHHVPDGAQGLQNPPVHPPEDLCHLRHCQRQGQGLAALSPETPLRSVSFLSERMMCILSKSAWCAPYSLYRLPREHRLTRMITIPRMLLTSWMSLYMQLTAEYLLYSAVGDWQDWLFNFIQVNALSADRCCIWCALLFSAGLENSISLRTINSIISYSPLTLPPMSDG